MRIADAGPRTWLLATVAAWALLAWLLSLANMGGRLARLPDDPSLVQPLPTVPKVQAERIGPLEQYAETAERPLFSEDRRPQPFSLQPQGEGEETQQFDFILTSVLITPQVRMAIVQPAAGGESIRMKQDESPAEAQGWRLVAIEPRSATFVGPQGEKTLQLRVFDGKGGSAPTQSRAPQPEINMDAPVQMTDADEVPPPPPPPPPEPAAADAAATANASQQPGSTLDSAPMTPEQQMDAIRKRIEQRRAQLRQEQQRQQQNQKPPAQQ
ncbi:MAG: general secretion pathway protein GspN [Lysobacter sp.]|nr:general secretion pathway protein GspN [Lysobacter sp.]